MIKKFNLEKTTLNELYKLEHAVFSHENFPLSKSGFRYHSKNNLILTYVIEDKIVGYILALKRKKTAKIYSLAVLPDFRKNGIAKELLNSMLLDLSEYKDISLEVRVDNEKAINLYKSKDFVTVKTLKEFYKDGCDAFYMKVQK